MERKEQKTERFEGGVQGLFRYYRSRHILLTCLLVPLIAGSAHALWILPGTGTPSPLSFVIAAFLALGWLSSSSMGSLAMGHLVIYASDGAPAEKSARWSSIFWHTLAINLAGYIGLAALLALLHALAGGLEPTLGLQVAQHSAALAFFFLTSMNAWLVDNHGIGQRFWLLILLAYFAVCFHLSLLSSPFILLPYAIGLSFYLLAHAVRQQLLRNHLLVNACDVFFTASFFMFFVAVVQGGVGFAWSEAALLAFAGAVATFAQHEKIRRGLFSTIPEFMERKMLGGSKKRVAGLLNPLEDAPWRWRWVRLVIHLAPYAWLIALISTIGAVAARLVSI